MEDEPTVIYGVVKDTECLLIFKNQPIRNKQCKKSYTGRRPFTVVSTAVYFRSHQLKHDSIFNITTSSFKILNDKENRGNSDNIEDLDSKNAGMFIILTIIALFLAIAVNSKQNDDSDAENNTKDKTLEEIRQLGLYFNFDREKNEWIVPKNQFTKEDYECSKGLFDVVMEVINAGLFSGNMSKTDMKDLVNDLQDIDITI